jgi:cytochrome-b5 reductase
MKSLLKGIENDERLYPRKWRRSPAVRAFLDSATPRLGTSIANNVGFVNRTRVGDDSPRVAGMARPFGGPPESASMDATVAVAAVREVGPGTVAIEFETPDGFEAEPGQFVKLSGTVDGEEYSRFYTLSSPGVEETFEVTVGVDPEEAGPFSRHLTDLREGDELDVSGPFGRSYYQEESRVVILAGGPGVGPAVGIGEAAVADGNEVAVVYQTDAPAHAERLDGLRDAGASVVVTEGAIGSAVADAVTGEEVEQVFVYGFDDFVEEAEAAIEAAGGDADAAKVENFG